MTRHGDNKSLFYLANLASCFVISIIFFISLPIGEKIWPNIICSAPIALIRLISVPIWSIVPVMGDLSRCSAEDEVEEEEAHLDMSRQIYESVKDLCLLFMRLLLSRL